METTAPTPGPEKPQGGGPSGSAHALLLALLLPAGLAAQLRAPLAGLLWTEIFVFLLPPLVLALGSNLEPRAWLRLHPVRAPVLLLAAIVGAAGWLLGGALFAAVRAVSPASLVRTFDLTRLFEGSLRDQLAFAAAAVIVAPVCEEVAFRGHLAAAWHARHRPATAIAASAVAFALIHLDPIRGGSLLALGALYGWIAWRSGSIWPAIAAHATNNGIAAGLAIALPPGSPAEEPTLGMALVGVGFGLVAVALAVAAFRRLPPVGPGAPGLPRADPANGTAGFRLSRVPRPLLAAAAAGWATLAALLATVRPALLVLLCVGLPSVAAARSLVVESRVDDGRWAHRPAVEARVDQRVALRVRPIRGGAIRWYRIVPDLSAPYNNAVWPWDPGAYRWIGYAKIRYTRAEVDAFRGRWEVALDPGDAVWRAGTHAPPVGPTSAPDRDATAPDGGGEPDPSSGPGSHWFQAEVELQGRTLASPGLAQNDHRGLSPDVQRVTFRDGDDLVGHLTGYFNVPGVFGSVPWQVRNYVGVDCADVLMAARARARGEPVERDVNVAGLTRLLPTVATATLSGGHLSRPLRWGLEVRRGDFLAVKYRGWGQYGHVGALFSDANGDGFLDAEDLVIHAGPSPLHLSTLGSGAFDGELRFLRPM